MKGFFKPKLTLSSCESAALGRNHCSLIVSPSQTLPCASGCRGSSSQESYELASSGTGRLAAAR